MQKADPLRTAPRKVFVRRTARWLGAAAIALALHAPALGQQTDPTGPVSTEELLKDFVHYVLIRNDELAHAYANALLQRGLSPVEFVGLVEDSPTTAQRFDEAVRRATGIASLEDVAGRLNTLLKQGRLDRARDASEIARNIAMLDQNPRARMLARERLASAREYAAPQLLEVLLARPNPSLEGHVRRLLIEMGGDAVAPLCAALPEVDPVAQERLAEILGSIEYGVSIPVAAPCLAELAENAPSETVRDAARRALERLNAGPMGGSVSDLYLALARDYYREPRSLTRFPDEEFQLLWSYEPQAGLSATAVRTEVFHEARVMELAERALQLNDDSEGALELWVAANFSREIDQPEGWDNPVWGPDRRDARFYAVTAGPRVLQNVLARALVELDTPLARRAIDALAQSAGSAGLWQGLGDRRPLLDALQYPDRRVQLEAALAIGAANPTQAFEGAERVTPILATAVRDAALRYALVISRDQPTQQRLSDLLRTDGWTVLPPSASFAAAADTLADAPGLDLILYQGLGDDFISAVDAVRNSPRFRATPVLALLPFGAYNDYLPRFERDRLVALRREGVDEAAVRQSVADLALQALGPPVTDDEARDYALRALRVLRDIAVGGSEVFNIADAATPLIRALDDTEGDLRLEVADVLAHIQQTRAQVKVMDAAMQSGGAERVALLRAVAGSAKRFGDMLDERQVRWLVDLATDGPADEATAAASLLGALNLPENRLVPLILSGR